jgi:GTPase SAR1 family protein
LRFVKDQFDDYRESTIGGAYKLSTYLSLSDIRLAAAFLTQTVTLDDQSTVKFEIWFVTPMTCTRMVSSFRLQGHCGSGTLQGLFVTLCTRLICSHTTPSLVVTGKHNPILVSSHADPRIDQAPMYYRNANCAVVVYDITQSASLEKARSWIRELQRQADPNIVIALCGNKSDLSARRQVSQEEAQKYAEEEGLMWAETSAKTGEGVSDVFVSIGKRHPDHTGWPCS